MTDEQGADDLGLNTGLVEDLYRQWVEDRDSLPPAWAALFEGRHRVGRPAAGNGAGDTSPAAGQSPSPAATPLRGPAARLVANMEASLGVPVATSLRVVPARLLEVNRRVASNHLTRMNRQAKVSFTHLIGYAVVKAIGRVPAMNACYAAVDGKPGIVRPSQVNLGIAVDVVRSGGRSLLVPSVKAADTLDFAVFLAAYEDLVERARAGRLTADDLSGTTVSLTNPGTLGTVSSTPRLMAGQGLIVGVGAIAYPAEFQGADPETVARLGVGKVVTLTSTYDHRVIQGAQSGEFLRHVHDLLLGGGSFYDEVFASLGIPYEPVRWQADTNPENDSAEEVDKAARVLQLINAYRVRGHLIADLDPLRRAGPRSHVELDPAHYGLTIWDLERTFATGGLAGSRTMKLADILGVVRDAYSRTVGVEYMHIQETEQKAWIQERIEGSAVSPAPADRHRVLERLVAAESFERFLHTKYVGHKRFGLEGAESLIPMLDALLSAAADAGLEESVLGMAHRGRLNVLANVVGKSYGQIFTEFEGRLDPASPLGSGDVKYHLGATGVHRSPSGATTTVTLAANPSHLEAVDSVVEGMTRAKQDSRADTGHDSVLAVLIHGDAAFAGQGVVAETFNLSALPGYRVGGTVHIVVNNQVGFTTRAEHGRSSVYPTDVAKMVQAPILHVNGDDPEACVRVVRLAFAFRQAFHKDVVIDMVCYRLHGHNEADEPAFTQPRMYALIEGRPSVRQLYTGALLARGDVSPEQAEAASADLQARLEDAFARTRQRAGAASGRQRIAASGPSPAELAAALGAPAASVPTASVGEAKTAVDRQALDRVAAALVAIPEGFTPHPKLARMLRSRSAVLGREVDWVQAEALAFGTLLLDGVPIRLAGQDTRRGTFSQRHAVLVDYRTEEEHVPLAVLGRGRAAFRMYDSLLSEYAALAFDYGYSLGAPSTLVCWEAQFGDFANGAQVVIDQFVAAGEEKWGQASGIVLLLPHGMEGQGPDHSSGRLERFLALCAGENLRVAYPTTAAQYFHLLRRQALTELRRPLVVMTPKRFLRMAATRSLGEELISGRFREVLSDPAVPSGGRRVLLCTGKVGHELLERRGRLGGVDLGVAVVRLEQLHPFPAEALAEALRPYPGAQVVWVQEEPENMGAWNYVRSRFPGVIGASGPGAAAQPGCIARPPRGSPATGTQNAHQAEQETLLTAALLGPDPYGPASNMTG